MKKKIVLSGPILSRSGYGEMARFALRALRSREELFDIYLLPTNWGATGNLFEQNEERQNIQNYFLKTQELLRQTNNQPNFDISIQVTIPNEWKKIAPINIGYTAGIETNMISPAWLEPSQNMDKIIVISEHAKSSFVNTIFGDEKGNQFKLLKPVEVCHFPVRDHPETKFDLELKTDFNFLTVCQWSPRKNLEQVIVNFIEEFKDENVGLVLKINTANDSLIDREQTEQRLNALLSNFKNRKCSVYFLHGHVSEAEMQAIYKHPKIKAVVSATHGEGFGFPLFEASYNELPVVATDWSGHLDFLSAPDETGKMKKMFAKVDFELKPIASEHVWQGVLEAGTSWAYPSASHFKSRLREVYKDYSRFKNWSKKLNKWVRQEFTEEKVFNRFLDILGLNHKKKTKKEIDGISFCIPTNGKRKDKTDLLIKSIHSQQWNNMPYEIILCGDIKNFDEKENIILIDKSDEANSRKVAVLRNRAAEKAKYETIVFCDDDIILDAEWLKSTAEYSKNNSWDVLSNKVLLPDNGRYWDRATISPHMMVSYDHPETDPSLYQSSAFFLVRKEIFEKVKWDETKLVYADKEGGIPEDLQYSFDLRKENIILSFNKNAKVWHYDDSYIEWNKGNAYEPNVCVKKNILENKFGMTFFPPHSIEFKSTIKGL